MGVDRIFERYWELTTPEVKDRELASALRNMLWKGPSQVPSFSAVYRAMRSLERRGHVAAPVDARPLKWVRVQQVRDGVPVIDPVDHGLVRVLPDGTTENVDDLSGEYVTLVVHHDYALRVRCLGKTWRVDYSDWQRLAQRRQGTPKKRTTRKRSRALRTHRQA